MNSQFRQEELIKVQGKSYPVVGGRLRLAHEENKEMLSIETIVLEQDKDRAIIQAKVKTQRGEFNGLGNATALRDSKLKYAILELAETRAIARALRFAGYGVEYTGYEEVSDIDKKADFTPEVSEEQETELYELADIKGFSASKVLKWVKENCKVDTVQEIPKEKYIELYKNIASLPNKGE